MSLTYLTTFTIHICLEASILAGTRVCPLPAPSLYPLPTPLQPHYPTLHFQTGGCWPRRAVGRPTSGASSSHQGSGCVGRGCPGKGGQRDLQGPSAHPTPPPLPTCCTPVATAG